MQLTDVINLLPDAIANQIAAGEVVQRPASLVKELMENSVDAGSTHIKLIIKDGGRTLVQVTDDGCGMSEADARICWERHATSKINKVEDLFRIRTKGFRGEAMASIAAVAQVEMRTRRKDDELGWLVQIEGSEIKKQEHIHTAGGTSIAVKNLFFNIPARRNFLKSDSVESRHIMEEFQRLALAHPEIEFTYHNNGNETYSLKAGTLKERIAGILGDKAGESLIAVKEETTISGISGFIGMPETAKKTRGEQFFFVNNRYIRDPYLNHAVLNAFEELLPKDSFPLYVLFLDIEPSRIDINVHPTKTEIKFEDERSIYTILKSVIRKALGNYTLAPEINPEEDQQLSRLFIPEYAKQDYPPEPRIQTNKQFNPFGRETSQQKSNLENWETLYAPLLNRESSSTQMAAQQEEGELLKNEKQGIPNAGEKNIYLLHNRYIVTQIKTGVMLIDQQAAHERILYERFYKALEKKGATSQQLLFPKAVSFSAADNELMKELIVEVKALGFDMEEFGKNTWIVNGVPAGVPNADAKELLEGLMENFKMNQMQLKLAKGENLARSMARQAAVRGGTSLSAAEMNTLIDQLFACEMPYKSPFGRSTVITISLEELASKFRN